MSHIFGSFPQNANNPGVCQIQMVKELLEDFTSKILTIKGVKNAKFVSVLTPDTHIIKVALSNVTQDDNKIKVQAIIANDETLYAKLSLQTDIA